MFIQHTQISLETSEYYLAVVLFVQEGGWGSLETSDTTGLWFVQEGGWGDL